MRQVRYAVTLIGNLFSKDLYPWHFMLNLPKLH